jgi:chorismate dehydratase
LLPKVSHLKKIRVAAVSYLNTKPLMYGIRNHPVINEIELVEEYPARIAQMLLNDEVDVGLVPVAVIPKLKEWHIVTDYCIGARREVASVCIFSEVPMEAIEEVYLDYQSRTSVNLAKILLREYWKKDVILINATGEDYRDKIKSTTAGVVIGDRALEQRSRSTFIYDLAAAWRDYTGLPFVFAAWISNKELPAAFIQLFNEANKLGVENAKYVARYLDYKPYDLRTYYTKNIDYILDEPKQEGLKLFLSKLTG